MGNYQPYTVGQNTQIDLDTPKPIVAIGGDNPTPFYLFFPSMPFGMQWVFPFIYGFMYPLAVPSYGTIRVDTSSQPAGAQVAPTSTALAKIVAYQATAGEAPPSFASGTPSIAATIQRWNINAAPATGSQATVAFAANPSAIHVADSFSGTLVAAASASTAGVSFQVLDGVSVIFTLTYAVESVAGDTQQCGPFGPGLQFRGTPGSAMTIKFGAGLTNVAETVNMNGYDQ